MILLRTLVFFVDLLSVILGDSILPCHNEEGANVNVSIVTSRYLSWDEASQYCYNQNLGALISPSDCSDPDRTNLEQALRDVTNDNNEWAQQCFWTKARFNCPSLRLYNETSTLVRYGNCALRSSFLCQYPGRCPGLTGSHCTTINDCCVCCYPLVDRVEPQWIQAESACRRYGGELATLVDKEANDQLTGFLRNSGTFWIGLTQEQKYSFYESHGEGEWCECVKRDLTPILGTCTKQISSICVRKTTETTTLLFPTVRESTTDDSLEQNTSAKDKSVDTRQMEVGLSIDKITAPIAVGSVLLISVTIVTACLCIRRRNQKMQEGSMPYDGIAFFNQYRRTRQYQNVTRNTHTHPDASAPQYSDLYSISADIQSSGAKYVNTGRASEADSTLPRDIPTLEVAKMVVQRGLNKARGTADPGPDNMDQRERA